MEIFISSFFLIQKGIFGQHETNAVCAQLIKLHKFAVSGISVTVSACSHTIYI